MTPRTLQQGVCVLLIAGLLAGHVAMAATPGAINEATAQFSTKLASAFCNQRKNPEKPSPTSFLPNTCFTQDQLDRLGAQGRRFAKEHTIVERNPVLLMPGLSGSALEVRLDQDARPPHDYCHKNNEWYQLWLALGLLLPGDADCFWYDLAIGYNAGNNTFSNNYGVNVRAIDFGGMKGIDYISRDYFGNGIPQLAYYAPMIKELEAAGFVAGKSIRGAPYDWRFANNPPGFYAALKSLIEEMYSQNNNKAVHVVAHSMANIHTGVFLSQQTQQWKDQYIASFIAVAGPWSGAPMALRTLISGNNLNAIYNGYVLIDPLKVRTLARQSGGVIWMMPDVEFWNTTVLVKTPTRTYDVDDFPQLFKDVNSEVSLRIHQKAVQLHDIPAPNVDMHCLYGINKATEVKYDYKNGWDKEPEITYDSYGDGLVPGVSLEKCTQYRSKQKEPVEVKTFDLADHFSVIWDPEVIQYVLTLATNQPKAPTTAPAKI